MRRTDQSIMNLNVETHSIRLLDNDKYEAAPLDIELELSPTEYQPQPCDDINPRNDIGNSGESNNFVGAITKGYLSEKMLRAVKLHHLRVARNERRSKSFLSVLQYTLAIFLCIIPVGLFAMEMIPERCKICLDHVELDTYFVISALCGGFGATLLSHDFWEYSLARFLGGAVSSLGALFTIWMILQAIPPSSSNIVAIMFIFVGILGAMPGVVVYFLVKIVSDECWVSSDLQDDFEDDHFTSLTKLIIITEEE